MCEDPLRGACGAAPVGSCRSRHHSRQLSVGSCGTRSNETLGQPSSLTDATVDFLSTKESSVSFDSNASTSADDVDIAPEASSVDDSDDGIGGPTQGHTLDQSEHTLEMAPLCPTTVPHVQTLGIKRVLLIVGMVVVCGCGCQAPYEVMNSRDKGCASLLTFVEYVFGIVASISALRQPRRLSWSTHLGLAASNLGYSVFITVALGSTLPTPVLIAMKNGNLVANMLLGRLVLRRRYTRKDYFAVLCVTIGLVFSSISGTTGSVDPRASSQNSALVGIVSLVSALLCRAMHGIVQEVACSQGGVTVAELLFFRSLLGLPIILLSWDSISAHAVRWSVEAQISGLQWPTLWVLLAVNMGFDYGTKVGMTWLISETSALTATLVLTFQRFVSFIISATMLCQEPPGWDLCFGVMLVLLGTTLYAVLSKPKHPPALKSRCN